MISIHARSASLPIVSVFEGTISGFEIWSAHPATFRQRSTANMTISLTLAKNGTL